MTAFKH